MNVIIYVFAYSTYTAPTYRHDHNIIYIFYIINHTFAEAWSFHTGMTTGVLTAAG